MCYTDFGILFSLEKQGHSDSFFFFLAWLNFEDIIIQARKGISSKTDMLHINSEEAFEETESRLVGAEA